jgi:glycosyltransferase involved in cell wall biosynthesis
MKQSNNVQIVTTLAQGLPCEEKLDGVPVRRIRKGRFLFDREQLLRILNGEDTEIINWHASDTWSAVQFWRSGKLLRKDIVWTLHSGILSLNDLKNLKVLEFFQLYKFWNNVLNVIVSKHLVKRWAEIPSLRHIITLSKRTARKLKDYGLNRDVTPIPSGVDVNLFRPLRNIAEDFTILYFGPLSVFRGIDVLLSAFKIVRKILPETHLVLLVRESKRKNCWFKKAEKLTNVDIVAGILDQKELVKQLGHASVVALPFKFWPQVECPLTILEAMAMEKPIITTDTGAIPEIINNGENGILITPGNAKVLAKAAIELLRDKDLSARIGKNARMYVQSFHDWDIIVKQTLNIFQSVMSQ